MYNGCDRMVVDYSLAVIDLINSFILFVRYQRMDDLFANLLHVRGLCVCLGGDSELLLN